MNDTSNEEDKALEAMRWKITRDPYYFGLLIEKGLDYVYEAGFFYDTDTVNRKVKDTVAIPTTPLTFLDTKKLSDASGKPCVLLSTGSFSPIHYGHIQMMELARQEVEQQGFSVMGGYISPGHDEYIKSKTGDQWIPIHHRIALINKAIKEREAVHQTDDEYGETDSWLSVDPWEGVFNKVAINFTDVIIRLEEYLEHYLGQKIPVIYVCGGDNARFARTFDYHGHCVVVERPGHIPDRDPGRDNPRVFNIAGSADISSTTIRNTQPPSLNKPLTLRLRIREEDEKENKVAEALSGRFEKTLFQSISSQQQDFDELFDSEEGQGTIDIVNLDTEIVGGHKLGISRHYDAFGARRLCYGERPGSSFWNQLWGFDFTKCVLFDDDIHSGGTMRFAKGLLEDINGYGQGITVQTIVSLNISDSDEEIADARDFLFGFHENAGLVVKLPGQLLRLPYLYPYVCPYLRASIEDPMEFSIEMWRLNAGLHKDSGITIGEIPHLQSFADYIFSGSPDTTMHEVCLQHAEMLESLAS